jgi:catechol 2,3-dioxygenase-like lactoylglutathione lyase family enzyme
MDVVTTTAQVTVRDLDAARDLYTRLLARGPDRAPMAGLLEWDLTPTSVLQVFAEPERAGRSTVVLGVADLDAEADRLAAAGVAHDGVAPVTSGRVLTLSDPDGNRVVLVGP